MTPSSSTGSSSSNSASSATSRQTPTDTASLRYTLISGAAGGIAGCLAKTSVAPLDRVKILFQTRSPDYQRYAGTWLGVFRASKDIYAETGVRGLLQGHSATLLRIFPYAAIKYMAYEKFHVFIMPTPERETSGRRFLAGSLAGTFPLKVVDREYQIDVNFLPVPPFVSTGVTSAMVTYPLELIRVRLAFEPHHSANERSSLLRTIRQIYLEPPLPLLPKAAPTASSLLSALPPSLSSSTPTLKPPIPSTTTLPPSSLQLPSPSLTHFYRGIIPTLVGIIPYAGTSFLIWGYARHDLYPSIFSPTTLTKHRAALDLLAGGIAGAIGQTAAYPLDIVRRRMQVGPAIPGSTRMGFAETAKLVYKTGGSKAFFVGLSIGYLKVIPMNAVSFASWVALKEGFGLRGESR